MWNEKIKVITLEMRRTKFEINFYFDASFQFAVF